MLATIDHIELIHNRDLQGKPGEFEISFNFAGMKPDAAVTVARVVHAIGELVKADPVRLTVLSFPPDDGIPLVIQVAAMSAEAFHHGQEIRIVVHPSLEDPFSDRASWRYEKALQEDGQPKPTEGPFASTSTLFLLLHLPASEAFSGSFDSEKLAARMRQVSPFQAISEILEGGGPKNHA